jgi:dipeptidyl aminopeptidase/acylaminoacyl peptidase
MRRIEPELNTNLWGERRAVTMAACNPELLVHSSYRYVIYPSFDGLKIPAYLTIPKCEVKAAIITTFYGGTNRYDPSVQMLAELGVACLSPAVRGSWGRGKTWEDMLKGDLGGNEILDVIWGARYLEKQFGLAPEQIGLQGESHGGYAVLRAITMPDGFNGQPAKYPFGFAICWAGFADLVEFHRASRIPDWLTDLLGPIDDRKDTYIDRSPITHFRELQTPLLISHGENDTRVPLSTMQDFIEALRRSSVPHLVHIQRGQGHTTPSKQDLIDSHVRELEFIRKYGLKDPN